MGKISNTNDNEFAQSLYREMRRQAINALGDQKKILSKARSYMDDGLTESECIELLVIDGLSRESADSYVQMINYGQYECGNDEYIFEFKDYDGNIYSSSDMGKTIFASSDAEAWQIAEGVIETDEELSAEQIISVLKI